MLTKYGWIVLVDHLALIDAGGLKSDVGKVGPRGLSVSMDLDLRNVDLTVSRLGQVKRWRCTDADGALYYEGRYIGPDDDCMFGPLEDFAKSNAGAISIAYFNESTLEWEEL